MGTTQRTLQLVLLVAQSLVLLLQLGYPLLLLLLACSPLIGDVTRCDLHGLQRLLQSLHILFVTGVELLVAVVQHHGVDLPGEQVLRYGLDRRRDGGRRALYRLHRLLLSQLELQRHVLGADLRVLRSLHLPFNASASPTSKESFNSPTLLLRLLIWVSFDFISFVMVPIVSVSVSTSFFCPLTTPFTTPQVSRSSCTTSDFRFLRRHVPLRLFSVPMFVTERVSYKMKLSNSSLFRCFKDSTSILNESHSQPTHRNETQPNTLLFFVCVCSFLSTHDERSVTLLRQHHGCGLGILSICSVHPSFLLLRFVWRYLRFHWVDNEQETQETRNRGYFCHRVKSRICCHKQHTSPVLYTGRR